MKLLLAVACLFAVAFADEHCNLMQRLKVKRQWAQAFGTAEDREAMGSAIWRYIFHVKPDAPHEYFERVHGDDIHSPEFMAHSGRVLSGFDLCLSLLTDEGPLNAQLHHLMEQHDEMHIPAEYFDVFSRGLQLAVHSILGRCFDEEAWHDCTDVIENGIKHH